MSKMLSNYATWFNLKYLRSGTLFSNRYKSEPVEDDRYYLGLIKYIHQNPLKAQMVDKIIRYPYSSYHEYINDSADITDINFSLDLLHDDRKKAISHFIELNEVQDGETYEISDSQRMTPSSIRRIIMSEINGEEPHIIKLMPKDVRNNLIKKLVYEKAISKSALERATGISRGTIIRICKQDRMKSAKAQLVPSFFD